MEAIKKEDNEQIKNETVNSPVPVRRALQINRIINLFVDAELRINSLRHKNERSINTSFRYFYTFAQSCDVINQRTQNLWYAIGAAPRICFLFLKVQSLQSESLTNKLEMQKRVPLAFTQK